MVLTAITVLFGWIGVTKINSETFPSVNIGAVVITTYYDGATAEDIETKITKPIEEEIQKVSGIKVIKSTSQAGFSTIRTEVDIDHYPVEKVIADMQRAVDRTSGLPSDLKEQPKFTEIKSDEFPVIDIAIGEGPQYQAEKHGRLRDAVADLLEEEVKDNKKVSTVTLTGFRERQFNILVSRNALIQHHVSIGEIQRALLQRNITVPGGEIKGSGEQKLLRIEGKAKSKEEIASLVIRSNFSGQNVKIADVAQVEDGSEEAVTLASINGKPATLVTIAKKGGGDILVLASQIEKVVAAYQKKYDGVLDFQIFNNEGIRVGDRLGVLISNGWQGMILVLFFMLIFLPGRVGIMASLSLPFSLFATLGAVMVMGYTLNTLTIIALIISIGMLVDNAVVISENFVRLRDDGRTTLEAIDETIGELWAPVTATVLTTVAAFLPMLVTTGVMGQFIKVIPVVVSISLLLCLAESFFLLPARLKLVNYQPSRHKPEYKPDFFERRLVPAFKKQVTWLVDRPKTSLGIYFGILFVTGLIFAFGNKINLFPTDQTEIYVGRLIAPHGTRLEITEAITAEVVADLTKEVDRFNQTQAKNKIELKSLVGNTGQSEFEPNDPKSERGTNTALLKIYVSKATQDLFPTNTVLEVFRKVQNTRLTRLTFEAKANGPPVGDPVTVTFRSNNGKQLNALAKELLLETQKIAGIRDAKLDDTLGDDEVFVRVDYDRAARAGLSLQDIGSTIRSAIAGIKLGDVNLNNREVDYFLRFSERDKSTLDSLAALTVADAQGNLIPLRNVSKFETHPGSPQIKRYDLRRAKTLTANIDDRVITSILANKQVLQIFERLAPNYPEVSIVFGGEAEKTAESVGSLLSALVLSLFAIFALMVLLFRSYLMPLVILTTIPLGLTGVSVAFFLQQKSLSFMALIGVIGLGGIIVNSGIILISFIESLKTEGNSDLRDVLVKASSLRLKSVLTSSLTTISGLVPTAYGIGGVDYFIIPMALALAAGLSTGTIFTLYWIPPAYRLTTMFTDYLGGIKVAKMKSLASKRRPEIKMESASMRKSDG